MQSGIKFLAATSIAALGMGMVSAAYADPTPAPSTAIAAIATPINTNPAAWAVDRLATAGFVNTRWQGRDDVLKLSIVPPAASQSFNNWQGYNQRLDQPAGNAFIAADMWISSDWTAGTGTDYVRTGIWGSALPEATVTGGAYVDAQAVFPIISFTNQGGSARLEIWDTRSSETGWVDLPGSAEALNMGGWNTFEMRVLPGADAIEYYVNGVAVYRWVAPRGSQDNVADQLWAVYLKARNNGVSTYDTYWSGLESGQIISDGETITAAPNGINLLADAQGSATLASGVVVKGSIVVGARSDTILTFEDAARVNTIGDGEHGVVSDQGGSVRIEGGAIATSGTAAHGLFAANAGSRIATDGTAINVTGAQSNGASANDGAIITIQGGSVGAKASVLYANGGAIQSTDAALTLNAAANNSAELGVAYARNGGTIAIDGGTVQAVGPRANGLMAVFNGTITATDAAITAKGDRGRGVYASADDKGAGLVTITGGSITTNGLLAHGLFGKRQSGASADTVARIDAAGVAIDVNGTDANGAYADAGSELTVTGGSIITRGLRGIGLHAQHEDDGVIGQGSLKAIGTQVTTYGQNAHAGLAEKGGVLTIENGALATQGSRAYGLASLGAGSLVSGNADITTQADWSFGAFARDGAEIMLTGGTIVTNGERAHGLSAEWDGTITSFADITTNGAKAHGAQAGTTEAAGYITLAGGSITTLGDGAYGLLAYSSSTISGIANIRTFGTGAIGASADGDGTVSLSGGQIVTSGDGAIGLLAAYDARYANAGVLDAAVDVTTSGTDAIGALAADGGRITLTGGTITTSGAGASGLAIRGVAPLFSRSVSPMISTIDARGLTLRTSHVDSAAIAIAGGGNLILSDSDVVSAGAGIAVAATGADAIDIRVAGSVITAGNGQLLAVNRQNGGGNAMIMAHFGPGSVLTGDIVDEGQSGGFTDVVLDGATLNGGVRGVRQFELGGGSLWTAQGVADIETMTIEGTGGTISAGSGALLIDADLVGSGALTKAGTGQVTLSGDGSGFTGTTIIDAGTILLTGSLGSSVTINADGTLQIGDGGTQGDLTGATRNDGTLIFARSDDYDYTGALSGNGGLIKRGDGTLLLSGAYSYTGTTRIEGGLVKLASTLDPTTDLVVDNGTFDLSDKVQEVSGLSGTSGVIALGETGALTVNQETNTVFAGNIAGEGSFTKTGAGSLNLTGDSNFTGEAKVEGGRLAVNGHLPGTVTVNSGGTLGGSGTIGAIATTAGGIVAPGNSIGTLNVTGDVAFGAGSVYAVEVDADGNSDRIVASGQANITGGTVSVIGAAGNYRWSTDYTILSAAGGVTGQFAGTDIDLLFLDPLLSYGANDVTLTLVRNDRTFANVAVTANQLRIAAALDAGSGTAALPRAIAAQETVADALLAFDALSGEAWASNGTQLIDQSRQTGELVLGRLRQADQVRHALRGSSASAATETAGQRTAIWGQVIGSSTKADGDGNAAALRENQYGFLTGIDTEVGNWRLGAAFGHGETKVNVAARASTITTNSNSAALYVGGGWQDFRLKIGATYGWHDLDGRRFIRFPGFSEEARGAGKAKTASAYGEISYAAHLGHALVEPFAGISHVDLKADAIGETGENAALEIGAIKRDVTYATLGLRAGADVPLSSTAVLMPRLSAAWQRGWGDLDGLSVNRLATGEAYGVSGVAIAKNSLAIDAGLNVAIAPRGMLGISYVGNVSKRADDHGLKIGFSYGF